MATRKPIRVLHLRDSPWVDGPGRTILETGSHLDSRRVEYHMGVLVRSAHDAHALVLAARERGIRVHCIVDRGGFDYRVAKQIRALVEGCDIDILHTSEFRSNAFGWLVRRGASRLKLVSTVHGWIANTFKRRITRRLDKLLLSRFDHVIVVSKATRWLLPLPDRQVTVLHNALVLGRYGADVVGLARRAPGAESRVVFVNVGRLSPEKGQGLLLRAFARLAREHPAIELHFAGVGPLEQELRVLARSQNVEGQVRFLGFIDDMPALYRRVDLVVQSSFTEGLPNVVLEAAFLRAPILATAVGGTTEVISHGDSGWLIEPHSESQLLEGMRAFLADPERFAMMALKAQRRILSEFSFEARTERLTALYESLCA